MFILERGGRIYGPLVKTLKKRDPNPEGGYLVLRSDYCSIIRWMETMKEINLNVNGMPRKIIADPKKTLLKVLREDLRLTGTKEGCSAGHCGTCAVIVDGNVILSCKYPIERAHEKRILTIEGIGTLENPHPLQRAFAANGAVQCGFCTPGMIVRAKWLIDKNPKPSRDEIKLAIQPHLCRCTGYEKIFRAIELAASFMRGETSSLEPKPTSTTLIGLELPRGDAIAKATGTTLFADDIPIDNSAYMKVVRSPYHHATIISIDKSEALKIPGVLAVLTAEDVRGTNILKMTGDDQPVICAGKVRMIGDPVAAVVAISERVALDVVEKVVVDYETLPDVSTVEESLKSDAPHVHEGKPNVFFQQPILYGDADQGFKEADVVVELDMITQCVDHAYLENDAGIAYIHDNGQLVVMTGSQNIYDHRRTIAEAVGLSEESVRIIQTPTGGAFGGKLDVSVGGLLAVAALVTPEASEAGLFEGRDFCRHNQAPPFLHEGKTGRQEGWNHNRLRT